MTVPYMATLRVEVGFSTGAAPDDFLTLDDTARGKLDTGTLAGVDEVFTDVTDFVLSFSTQRGSSRIDGPIVRYEAGTCSVVFNNSDRRFDPTNLVGPYAAGGATQVTPMRPVRIMAEWDGTTYPVFRGYVDDWAIDYDGPTWSTTTMTATDAFKYFQNYARPAVAPVGAGEDSGARVNRILDDVEWSATDRVVSTGDSTLQATTLEGDTLAELQLVADSELGEFYVDGSGRAVFRNRLALLEDTRSNTSQDTFTDDPVNPGDLPYEDATIAYDDLLFNYVRITREGGTEQIAFDAASRAIYLTRTYERSDLIIEGDTDALNLARWVLAQSKDPELRFDELTLNVRSAEGALWAQALGREIGDRVTIILNPPGGGDPIERDVFVRGITHDATPDRWTTTWTLQSGLKGSFMVLDNATLGTLDDNALAY